MTILKGKGSRMEFTGITFAGKGQNLDTDIHNLLLSRHLTDASLHLKLNQVVHLNRILKRKLL